MKLKNKLFLYFDILFFVTINIYGVILIETNFNTVIENTISGALEEYSVICANIESNSNAKNIFFNQKNNSNPNVSLQFRNMDKEIIYINNK